MIKENLNAFVKYAKKKVNLLLLAGVAINCSGSGCVKSYHP